MSKSKQFLENDYDRAINYVAKKYLGLNNVNYIKTLNEVALIAYLFNKTEARVATNILAIISKLMKGYEKPYSWTISTIKEWANGNVDFKET